MRFVPTRVHGVIDYLSGVLLVLAPWLFGFADGGAAQWVPVIIGVMVLLQSLVTDYEMGAMRRLPMPMHLMLDGMGGALLLLSPWLFGFVDRVWFPHVAFGMFSIVMSLITLREPGTDAGRHAA